MYILQAYDDALKTILEHGVRKSNRTGIDTLGVFGLQSRYPITEYFPLLTKRKIWPRSIFAELLWFISGSTNNKDLQNMNSNIWTPWVSEEFEKKNNFSPGSFGPVYGFQLRHFGGNYNNGVQDKNYGKDGFDQLENMVNLLKNDPDNRRNLFSLWNPKDISTSRLPPCHYTFQVYVHENKLSGILTQRSCDFPVGVPANIQFYSALIYMLAQQTGLEPHEFIHNTNDSHIYVNQIQAVEEYLGRLPVESPKLNLRKAKDIYSYDLSDFVIEDYNPLASIKIEVAI